MLVSEYLDRAKSGNEERPVMVYIPGGAFTGGSGNCPVYDGENLAKKALVVVTINSVRKQDITLIARHGYRGDICAHRNFVSGAQAGHGQL